jgi:hypothetical protein
MILLPTPPLLLQLQMHDTPSGFFVELGVFFLPELAPNHHLLISTSCVTGITGMSEPPCLANLKSFDICLAYEITTSIKMIESPLSLVISPSFPFPSRHPILTSH